MITRLLSLLDRLRPLRIIADPTDDTITFSRALCRRTKIFDKEKAEVLVFRTPDGCYNFCFAEDIADLPKDTATWPVQYNTRYNTAGFHCPEPTVNRIFYDYGLSPDGPCQLRISIKKVRALTCYQLTKRRPRPFSFK